MNTNNVTAARVLAKLQDEIQGGRKLHTLVVMDGHTFKVDLAKLVAGLQPADHVDIVEDDTDKAIAAMIANGFAPDDVGLCALCNERDACPRGNGEADLCDVCYAAWERAGYPNVFTVGDNVLFQEREPQAASGTLDKK